MQPQDIKLTRKQKAFADELINNPKQPMVQAALKTYGRIDKPVTYGSARQIAVENLQKPSLIAYLGIHADEARNKIVELVKSEKEEVALNASKDILDRFYGKATQRTEITTTGVTFQFDLTSSLDNG